MHYFFIPSLKAIYSSAARMYLWWCKKPGLREIFEKTKSVMAGREILEFDKLSVAKLPVKSRRLPRCGPEVDSSQIHADRPLFGALHHRSSDSLAPEFLFHPNEVGIEPVPEHFADQSADESILHECERGKRLVFRQNAIRDGCVLPQTGKSNLRYLFWVGIVRNSYGNTGHTHLFC